MASGSVFPRLHVLVVCDDIDQTQEEDVFDLIHVRTHIHPNIFPYIHPQLCIYVQATGHSGTARCRIAITDAADVEWFAPANRGVNFEGPLQIVTILWRLGHCVFPRPGLYYVQVYFNEKLCGERMLRLSHSEVSGNGQES